MDTIQITMEPECRNCAGSVNITQPNPGEPDRIIAICTDCGTWHFGEVTHSPAGRPQRVRLWIIEPTATRESALVNQPGG
jgi:hypothetical protein